jgi:hypothetical protein
MRLILPLLLLLFTGVMGLRNGWREYHLATTGAQRFTSATEMAFGAVSWVALAALLRKRRQARGLLILWAALVTLTGAVAAVAWGNAGLGAAAVGAVCVAAVCGLTVWLAETWRLRSLTSKGAAE